MVKRLWLVPFLFVPCIALPGPMRYELALLPGQVFDGNGSWDHSINNPALGCSACHTSIDQLGPSGNISTPTTSGTFALNTLKVRFYGDSAGIGSFPNPNSPVAALRSTGTAAGHYLYPGRATLQVPLVSPLVPLSSVADVSVGQEHACALTSAGGVLCWGSNTHGQLGNNSTTGLANPVAVVGLSSNVKSIAAGTTHTCALTSAGGVLCWGSNANGELGNNTTVDSPVPVPVTALSSGVTGITAGYQHSCAVTATSGVVCWGDNSFGQLGNNTTVRSLTPVAVSGAAAGYQSVTAGSLHTCAMTTAGGAACWGADFWGQLGNNTITTSQPVPGAVAGLSSKIVLLTAHGDSTCAVTTSGQLLCWGLGLDGSEIPIPTPIAGLSSSVKQVAIGDDFDCALTSAGGVLCWGYNDAGQLGRGTITGGNASTVPQAVTGLPSGIRSVAAGTATACAVTSAQGLLCWGAGGDGQLGNTTTGGNGTGVPVAVLAGIAETATFSAAIAPAAAMFVSVDATHHSLGIGSGWPNIAPTFPGGVLGEPAQQGLVDIYDLATSLPTIRGHLVSNYLFPNGWPATNPLIDLVGGGSVLLNPQAPSNGAQGAKGDFTATALTPMSAFAAGGGWAGALTSASIKLQGRLTLGAGANLFVSTNDDFVFGFGPYTLFLPSGSFTHNGADNSYSGTVNGSPAQVTLANTGGTHYTYSIDIQSVNLIGIAGSIPVALYMGDNAAAGTPSPLRQKIVFKRIPLRIHPGVPITLAVLSTSELAVTLSTLTPSVCAVADSVVTGRRAGTCIIAADQAGNGIYAPAPQIRVRIAVDASACHRKEDSGATAQSPQRCFPLERGCCIRYKDGNCCES